MRYGRHAPRLASATVHCAWSNARKGVVSFLNTLITDAARGGRALTAEELLQRTEALIGPELESDAEVHALVLSMISASM